MRFYTDEEIRYLIENAEDLDEEFNHVSGIDEITLEMYQNNSESIEDEYLLSIQFFFCIRFRAVKNYMYVTKKTWFGSRKIEMQKGMYAYKGFMDFIDKKLELFRLKDELSEELAVKGNRSKRLKI